MQEQVQTPVSTSISARQVVLGAGVVLFTVLAFAMYSAGQGAPSEAVRARRAVMNSVAEACQRYDKPDETELDEACERLLKDEGSL